MRVNVLKRTQGQRKVNTPEFNGTLFKEARKAYKHPPPVVVAVQNGLKSSAAINQFTCYETREDLSNPN